MEVAMHERVMSPVQEWIDASTPRRRLRDKVAELLSGSFTLPPLPELREHDRETLAGHLEESATRSLRQLVTLDARMFSMTEAEASFETPVTLMVRAVAAAVRAGKAEVSVADGLDRSQTYGVSALLEASQFRAQTEAPVAAAAISEVRKAWGSQYRVTGSPAERHAVLAPMGKTVWPARNTGA